MNEYYGSQTTPTQDFLAHYGVRGMKWGFRKAIQRTSQNSRPKSIGYANAEKKLKRATMAGGLLGGAAYAASHRNELASKPKKPRGVRIAIGNKAYMNQVVPKRKTSKQAYADALRAGERVENARNNLSRLGKMGFGRTAKEYRNANIAARNATNEYYNSLSRKQYEKLRRKHIG